jgi:hypothetical protein
MRRATALLVLGLLLAPRAALADGPAPAPATSPAPESPKRPVPDYDGRGPPPATPGETALWVPRVALSPAYLVTEYVLRRPIGAGVSAAERADLPRKLYDFFTFGPQHEAGVFPVGFVEFNFNPSVGVYAFWDDAGFRGDHLRAHVELWPDEWYAGSLTQQVDIDHERSLRLRVSGHRRPDRVFYGIGPGSLQSSQSRYGEQRVELAATYAWRWWRSSRVETTLGVRDVATYDGHFAGDPSVSQEAATGAFALPDGFGGEYTAELNRVVASVDTRDPDRGGTGIRFEAAAEQGNEVRRTPASGWIRYGGTVAGYVDLTGRRRVLGLSVTTLFTDPLGSQPVPFSELAYLGGDRPMPAYFAGRLVDRSAAAATLSYGWPIAPWLDGRLQVAVGNVFGTHLDAFDARLLRLSGAFGLSVAGLQEAPLEFLVGLGTETFEHGSQMDSIRVMLGVPHTF